MSADPDIDPDDIDNIKYNNNHAQVGSRVYHRNGFYGTIESTNIQTNPRDSTFRIKREDTGGYHTASAGFFKIVSPTKKSIDWLQINADIAGRR